MLSIAISLNALSMHAVCTAVFVVIAVVQMALWAKKKERRYRKELGPKYQKKRYAMLPGIY